MRTAATHSTKRRRRCCRWAVPPTTRRGCRPGVATTRCAKRRTRWRRSGRHLLAGRPTRRRPCRTYSTPRKPPRARTGGVPYTDHRARHPTCGRPSQTGGDHRQTARRTGATADHLRRMTGCSTPSRCSGGRQRRPSRAASTGGYFDTTCGTSHLAVMAARAGLLAAAARAALDATDPPTTTRCTTRSHLTGPSQTCPWRCPRRLPRASSAAGRRSWQTQRRRQPRLPPWHVTRGRLATPPLAFRRRSATGGPPRPSRPWSRKIGRAHV